MALLVRRYHVEVASQASSVYGVGGGGKRDNSPLLIYEYLGAGRTHGESSRPDIGF